MSLRVQFEDCGILSFCFLPFLKHTFNLETYAGANSFYAVLGLYGQPLIFFFGHLF